jgi:hypothetical protein
MSAPEARPILESATERAKTRFAEAVSIARQLAEAERSWVRLTRLLWLMERDGDFKRLGFDSVNACIMEIEALTGYGRSSIYAFRKLYEECSRNGVAVPEMPLSSGHVFKQLPAQLQRDPQVIDAATKLKPKQFREKINKEHPDSLIETQDELKLHLEHSLFLKWREVVDEMRVLREEPALTYEGIFEQMIVWSLEELWQWKNEEK